MNKSKRSMLVSLVAVMTLLSPAACRQSPDFISLKTDHHPGGLRANIKNLGYNRFLLTVKNTGKNDLVVTSNLGTLRTRQFLGFVRDGAIQLQKNNGKIMRGGDSRAMPALSINGENDWWWLSAISSKSEAWQDCLEPVKIPADQTIEVETEVGTAIQALLQMSFIQEFPKRARICIWLGVVNEEGKEAEFVNVISDWQLFNTADSTQ